MTLKIDKNSKMKKQIKEASTKKSLENRNETDLIDSEPTDSINGDDNNFNTSWANQISKILGSEKPKRKKSLVLSRVKKKVEIQVSKKDDYGFEIEGEQVANVTEETNATSDEPVRKKKKEIRSYRAKPNILDADRERKLRKIATRGVVQLFNAVKQQQDDISQKIKEVGPSETKRDKVLKNIDKNSFLDILMGEKSEQVETNNEQVVELSKNASEKLKNKNETNWNVLNDDFMLSAKLKDWDKEVSDEEELEIEKEIELED